MGEAARAAVEAVASHVAARWEAAEGVWPDAWLTIAGTRIAVEVAVIAPAGVARGSVAKPRLRFDKVALRLVDGLRAAMSEIVPDGEAVVVTITAPIRLASKTAAALDDVIQARLANPSARADFKDSICGNQVQVRFVTGVSGRMPKAVGFVHNPDPDSDQLLDLTQALLLHVGAAADRRPPPAFTGDRWLVLADPDGRAPIETWRQVYAQLAPSTDFKTVLMAPAGGRVETLTG